MDILDTMQRISLDLDEDEFLIEIQKVMQENESFMNALKSVFKNASIKYVSTDARINWTAYKFFF